MYLLKYLLKYIEKAEKIMRKTYTIFLCHVWGHPLTTWKHFLGIFGPPPLTSSWTLLLNMSGLCIKSHFATPTPSTVYVGYGCPLHYNKTSLVVW